MCLGRWERGRDRYSTKDFYGSEAIPYDATVVDT